MSKPVIKDIYEFSSNHKKQISLKVSFPYGTKYLSNLNLIYQESSSDKARRLSNENLVNQASNEKLFCYSCKIKFTDFHEMRKHQWERSHMKNIGFLQSSTDNIDSDNSDEIDNTFDEKLFEEELEVENDVESDEDAEPLDTEMQENIDNNNIKEIFQIDYISAIKTGKFSFNEVCTFPTVYFQNENSEIVGIKRCLLFNKKNKPNNEVELIQSVNYLSGCKKLAVFLYSGGCFSGAIFEGNKQILHKSIKRYTYRRQQGGSQTTRDNQNGMCKSGGAYLRRVNTQKLIDDVFQLLHETWAKEIAQCGLILVWSAKCQRHIFGHEGMLNSANRRNQKLSFDVSSDPRVRFISARVSKVNSSTLLDVFRQVSTLEIYDSSSINDFMKQEVDRLAVAKSQENVTKKNKKKKPKKKNKNKFTEDVDKEEDESKKAPKYETDESSEEFEVMTPVMKEEDEIRTKLLNYVLNDSAEDLVPYISELRLSRSCEEISGLLSAPLKTKNQSLLHLAISHNNNNVIYHLLECGCDPIARNTDNETPYAQAIRQRNKTACNVMSEFMFKNPDLYDYHAAKFPGGKDPLKEEERKKSLAEKKKQNKKDKKQRLKLQAEERTKEAIEKCQRDQFLALDSVSKMSYLKQVERDQKKRFLLCFQCALDISNVVPFSYSDFSFCGMECLKKHRISNIK